MKSLSIAVLAAGVVAIAPGANAKHQIRVHDLYGKCRDAAKAQHGASFANQKLLHSVAQRCARRGGILDDGTSVK